MLDLPEQILANVKARLQMWMLLPIMFFELDPFYCWHNFLLLGISCLFARFQHAGEVDFMLCVVPDIIYVNKDSFTY